MLLNLKENISHQPSCQCDNTVFGFISYQTVKETSTLAKPKLLSVFTLYYPIKKQIIKLQYIHVYATKETAFQNVLS